MRADKPNFKQTLILRKAGYDLVNTDVLIPELKQKGTIMSIFIGETGVQYNVRYFFNGEVKTVYLYDFEIRPIEEIE